MEAKELRIGNWVNVPDLGDVQVSAISRNAWIEVLYYKHEKDGTERIDYCVYYGCVSPIALTPEILESAGFEDWGEERVNKWETCHYYVLYNAIEGTSSFKVCFITSNYDNTEPYSEWVLKIDNDTIYNKGLEYLHQLQNVIFALTYQELTINLHARA